MIKKKPTAFLIRRKLPLVACFMLLPFLALSQKTKVSGKVYDVETGEPLPFVNISFKGSKIGTTTNMDGKYAIETYYATDSLVASSIGYKKLAKKVKKDIGQVIDFPMEPGSVKLDEVVVKYEKRENPAHTILRSVIKNKKINNREKLEAYEYEVYNKVEFDLNNIDDDFKQKRVFKPFQFVFEYVDTSEAKPFLPIFISETVSDFYYRRNPKSQKEIIKANHVSGIDNESVSQFMGDMYQNVNIYHNYIIGFGKSFVSPVSDFGRVSYKYYLVDSAYIDNQWCYNIKFVPKRKHELTFKGDMWIHDTTYAVKKVDATISGDANINWIHEFSVSQTYDQVEPEVWMLVKDHLVVDFAITDGSMGFYGRKTTTYRDFMINQPKEDKFYFGADNIIVNEGASKKDKEYWEKARHVQLSDNEKNIYTMVDTIRTIPQFRTYVDVITLIVSGYHVVGKFELGPYFTTYSFNQVEGHRFRLGAKTSNAFSTRYMIEAYTAFGTWDQKFKYGSWFEYFLSKKPRQKIGLSYKHDVEQLGQGRNAWREDNILTSVFRRNPLSKLNGYDEYNVFYEREWFQGFSNKLSFTHRTIWPLGTLEFDFRNGYGSSNTITTAEAGLYTRFAYKEKYVSGEFDRVSIGTDYPIIQAIYKYGMQGVLGSDYEYHKLVLNIEDDFRLNPFGYLECMVEGGKVFGKLPFPLLELHNGNETYSFDQSAFNLMNYYEFVSDEYVSLALTHHFNGLFLNKVPLIRKLKWRELISAKAVAGSLHGHNREILNFPPHLSTLKRGPYYEAGIGLENIFKLLRIEALWRMAYTNKEYVELYESKTGSKIPEFGIRGTLQITF